MEGPRADILLVEDDANDIAVAMRAFRQNSLEDHVRVLRRWSDAHYVSLTDLGARRAIDRQQIELVAARVSALNQCFY